MAETHPFAEYDPLRVHPRNLAIVIAESLARVVVAIQITGARWRSCPSPPPPKTQNLVLIECSLVTAFAER